MVKHFMDTIENVAVGYKPDGPNECMSFFSIANTLLLTMVGDDVYLNSSYKSLSNGSTKLSFPLGN